MVKNLFNNIYDPMVSLQLNNKYWPNSKFNLIKLLEDCDGHIVEKGSLNNSPQFNRLKKILGEELYHKVTKRLGKIICFKSNFGLKRAEVNLDNFNKYDLDNPNIDRKLLLFNRTIFKDLNYEVKNRYISEYGYDLVRINRSIRYHEEDINFDLDEMNYYHFDELKSITCIIYFSTVKPENGAFSYIDGSELIPRSDLLTAIHQAVAIDMGVKSPEALEFLPLEFRSSPNIGHFLNPDKAKLLKNYEVIIDGDVGTAFMFNGQRLLHRGGHVKSGHRIAGFLAPEGIIVHKIRSLFSNPNILS